MSDDCCAPGNASTAAASATAESHSDPLVEVLYFDGCPNHEPALALVKRVARELGLSPEIRLVHVPDQEAAQRLRFLGSPTIRVGGRDVDPNAEERSDRRHLGPLPDDGREPQARRPDLRPRGRLPLLLRLAASPHPGKEIQCQSST